MKKNSINTAILASLAGIAGIANISSAVNINPDGTGQVLIYPYYTLNAGNQTLLSVVNTTNQGKAVKVRVLEGRNSQEVLDFNLFLSREDVWTAAILDLAGATGAASIITLDKSCTAPSFASEGTSTASGIPFVSFRNFLYVADTAGGIGLDRTREGHIELIEMATLDGALNTAITHVSGTDVPANCASVASGVGPLFAFNANNVPSGGLFGGAAVINIANGTYTNYAATAIDGFWSPGEIGYSSPDSILPSLSNARPQSLVFSNGRVITSNWGGAAVGGPLDPGQRIDAVSAIFMSDTFLNEYTTETGIAASSEWVVTFPTKRFYVDRTVAQGVIAPFTSRYTGGQSCDPIGITSWNREEFTTTVPTGFSPPQGRPIPEICFETNVLSFNQVITNGANGTSSPTKILGSVLGRNINTPRIPVPAGNGTQAGWTRIDLSQVAGGVPLPGAAPSRLTRASVEVHRFVGLPVTGFWAVSIENNNATPGVKGFYGGAFNHRSSRNCQLGVAQCFVN